MGWLVREAASDARPDAHLLNTLFWRCSKFSMRIFSMSLGVGIPCMLPMSRDMAKRPCCSLFGRYSILDCPVNLSNTGSASETVPSCCWRGAPKGCMF